VPWEFLPKCRSPTAATRTWLLSGEPDGIAPNLLQS
jgi:hypothetical protein